MGLNNIQQKKNTVLNRPMFARMRDGRIVPVQRHWIGAAISIVPRVLPMIPKSRALVPYVKKPLQKYVVPKIKSAKDSLWKALGWGTTLGTAPYVAHSLMDEQKAKGEDEIKVIEKEYKPGTEGGAVGSTIEETEKFTDNFSKKDSPDAKNLDTEIKKGTLDDLITERIGIFEKHLGDGKEAVKSGGFAALTEFGLNLASARGGNLMDKIARSAKDPLKTFTAIGMAAKDRSDKIKMAAVEAGMEAEQASLDRAAEADPEGTTFQRNLGTLRAMFTDPDTKKLTIDEEDLVNMAKAGGTTSRKEFLSSVVPDLITKIDQDTGITYTPEKARSLAEAVWAQISGDGGSEKIEEEKKEVIVLD